jgi:hypothetical protein
MTVSASVKVAPRVDRPPPRSAERQALASCISRRDAAALALEAGQRAVTRASDAVAKAEGKVQRASAAAAEAGERHACELAEAMADGHAAPASTTRAARAAMLDAEDEAAAAHGAHAKLKASLADLEDAALDAQNHVTSAADRVLRTSAEQVLDEAEAAALKLRELRPLLLFYLQPELDPATVGMGRREIFGTDWDHERRVFGAERGDRRHYAAEAARRARSQPFEEIDAAIKRFMALPPHTGQDWFRHPALEPWRKCREALHHDADAVLPALMA